MTDVQSNINLNIDTSGAISEIKALQRQISTFHQSMAAAGKAANAEVANMQQNLINNINAINKAGGGQAFGARIVKVASETEAFTRTLERNGFSMKQYFRNAAGATKTFSNVFKNEFNTIQNVAESRVKTLQTQFVSLGRDANGAMRAIQVRPLALDLNNLSTQTQIAAQKAQIFNELVKQGSTQLLNWGKNTQWAGRQLMVGFTIPLGIMASAASKAFMELDKQTIAFRRVYGDMNTTASQANAAADSVKKLAANFTQYGVSLTDTMSLAAKAAAMGKQGADLMSQISETTRLAVLGNVDQEQALETTISLTNAFGIASDQLASKIDFLNAVENQTVTSISDLTEAIPKAGPVVQQLGGDVEDLTFFLTAMREGGINAAEGANALKSGLAAMINPTGKAASMLQGLGIDLVGLVQKDKGNVKQLIVDFAGALDKLDPTTRAQAIEQLFGKFQFARMSTLFKNVIAQGSQAQKVLELTNATTQELASLSKRELDKVAESSTFKFQKALTDFQMALAPIGEQFLKLVTPFIEWGSKILDQFNKWDEGAKQFTIGLVAGLGGVVPVIVMTVGLFANFGSFIINLIRKIGNMFAFVRNGFKSVGQSTAYMTEAELRAEAIASSLDQTHATLAQTFNVEAQALERLTLAYQGMISKQQAMMGMATAPGGVAANALGPNGKPVSMSTAKKEAGLYSAPRAVKAQNQKFDWGTLEAERAAVMAAVAGDNLNEAQLRNLLLINASHTEDQTRKVSIGGEQTTVKDFKSKGITPDLGSINMFANNTLPSILNEVDDAEIGRMAKKLGLSLEETAAEVDRLRQNLTPTTRGGAKVLRELARKDTSYFGRAADATLTARLKGKYYETMGQRQYDPTRDEIAQREVDAKVAEADAIRRTGIKGKRARAAAAVESQASAQDARTRVATIQNLPEGYSYDPEKNRYYGPDGKQTTKAKINQVINPPKPSLRSRLRGGIRSASRGMMGGAGFGVGMAASGAGMIAGMMGNEGAASALSNVGNIAMAVSSIGMLIPMIQSMGTAIMGLGAVAGPVTLGILGVVAVLGTLAFLAWKHSEDMKKISKDTKKTVDSIGASRSAMQKMAEAQGKVLPSDIIAQQRADAIAGIKRGAPGEATSGEKYLQTDAGKAIKNSIKEATKTGLGEAFTAKEVSQQLAAGISNGLITNLEAVSIADALSAQLKDNKLGADIKGNLISLTSSDGKDAFEKGLDLKVNLIQDVTKQVGAGAMSMLTAKQTGGTRNSSSTSSVNISGTNVSYKDYTDVTPGVNRTSEQRAAAIGVEASILQQRVSVSQQAMDALTLQRQKDEISQEQYEKGRAEILKAGTAAYKQNLADIKALTPDQQQSLSDTLGSSITDMFKGTPMEAYATLATSNANTLDMTTRLTVQTAIVSGSLSPTAFNNIFSTYGGDTKQIDAVVNLDSTYGSGTAEVIGQISPYIGKTGVINLTTFLNADTTSLQDGQKLLDIISMASASGEGLNVAATLDFISNNAEAVLADWNSWEGMSDQEKTVRLQFETNGFKLTMDQWNEYAGLPDYQQKVFRQVYTDEILTIRSNFTMSNGVFNLTGFENAAKSFADAYNSAMSAALNTSAPSTSPSTSPTTTGGGGGGGGTPEDAQLTQYNTAKDYIDKQLAVLKLKEDKINDLYDKRKKALEEIAALQKDIVAQQRDQLDVADALTKGDIAAAARAAQQYRMNAAARAQENQQKALEQQRQNALNGVTVNGKTREQMESELSRLNQMIADRELALATPAGSAALSASLGTGGTGSTGTTTTTRAAYTYPGLVRQGSTGNVVKKLQTALNKGGAGLTVDGIFGPKTAAAVRSFQSNNSLAVDAIAGPNTWRKLYDKGLYLKLGGYVAAMAAGGKVNVGKNGKIGFGMPAIGTDKIPAMLTAGEFVVQKPAVDKLGIGKLQQINSGKYDSGSVYNYSINVTTSGNANADDIARAVIKKIRDVDSMRLGGNRY